MKQKNCNTCDDFSYMRNSRRFFVVTCYSPQIAFSCAVNAFIAFVAEVVMISYFCSHLMNDINLLSPWDITKIIKKYIYILGSVKMVAKLTQKMFLINF